jgi:hypothetical protein
MEPKTPATQGSTFPPIGDLFTHAWERLSKSLLMLVFLTLLSFAGYGVVLLCGFLLVLASGIIPYATNANTATSLPSSFTIILLVITVVFVVFGFIIIASVVQIGTMLLLKTAEHHSMQTLIKKSLSLIIPLAFTGMLVGLIETGGLFLFIIPGIIFSMFFSFVPYIVAFDNKSYMSALKESYRLVSHNFGALFLRWIVFIIIYLLIVFLPSIISEISKELGGILSVVSICANIVLGWYAVAFGITLVEQAKAATPTSEQPSLTWIIITTIIGWVIGILLFVGIMFAIVQFGLSAARQGGLEGLRRQSSEYQPPFPPENPTLDEQTQQLPLDGEI